MGIIYLPGALILIGSPPTVAGSFLDLCPGSDSGLPGFIFPILLYFVFNRFQNVGGFFCLYAENLLQTPDARVLSVGERDLS
jgi:hypothetical protein